MKEDGGGGIAVVVVVVVQRRLLACLVCWFVFRLTTGIAEKNKKERVSASHQTSKRKSYVQYQ